MKHDRKIKLNANKIVMFVWMYSSYSL